MKKAEFLKQVRTHDREKVEAAGGMNKWLMAGYMAATGQTEFNTFNQWKSLGFRVRKGESSYPLFSRPLNVLKQLAGKPVSDDEVMRFGVCHLFHKGQVDPINPIVVQPDWDKIINEAEQNRKEAYRDAGGDYVLLEDIPASSWVIAAANKHGITEAQVNAYLDNLIVDEPKCTTCGQPMPDDVTNYGTPEMLCCIRCYNDAQMDQAIVDRECHSDERSIFSAMQGGVEHD